MSVPSETVVRPRVSRPRQSPFFTSASNAHTVVSVLITAAAGVAYLLIPGALAASAVGTAVGPLNSGHAWIWAACLAIGGVMAFAGILASRPRIEVMGLGILGGAVLFATAAIFDVRSTAMLPGAFVYGANGLAAVGRMFVVVHVETMRARVAAEAEARKVVPES